jgi:hypothetical protein
LKSRTKANADAGIAPTDGNCSVSSPYKFNDVDCITLRNDIHDANSNALLAVSGSQAQMEHESYE